MRIVKQVLSRFKLHFPRAAHAIRSNIPGRQKRRKKLENQTPQEIFSQIYEENYWGNSESRSGSGSTLDATASIRRELPKVFAELGAQSMLDAPCGDFHWMREVEIDLELYIGGDIVPSLIERLSTEFASDNRRNFQVIDLTHDPLPDVDVLFCRDCLQHLAVDLAQQVLVNFRRSSCRYLITTTFPDVKLNLDEFTGGTNTLNLQIAPFDLPTPMQLIEDRGSSDDVYRHCLGVWSRDQLV